MTKPKKYNKTPISEFPQKKAMKIEIARQIAAHLRDNNITQAEAAIAYNIDQAVMSRICNANLDIFTVDRLIGMAESMGIVANINFVE
jgi:predicted XRE-type DNA-binding protein